MPRFLADCHYNEEEISRHLKKNVGYRPVQINGNKCATGQILKNPVGVVKGRILAGWAKKSPEPCARSDTVRRGGQLCLPLTIGLIAYTGYRLVAYLNRRREGQGGNQGKHFAEVAPP
jgi:hypothetical protein